MAESKSEIQSFYKGKNVFVTGATGFLGKLLVEKLLSVCLVEKVYMLVRPKKGKSEVQRFKEIFDFPIFQRIRKEQPDFYKRVILVAGDCVEPNLGIAEQDKLNLISNVHIVFHCAATVRFDQKLRTAAYVNVRATRDLLALSKEMKHLKAFIYVSTAFSNCHRTDIDEIFYEPRISGAKLMRILDDFDDEFIEGFTPSMLGMWPNIYTFTKSISEDAVKHESIGLPVALVRPSMVISTYNYPIKGWIDNIYGPIGFTLGVAIGLLRTVPVSPESNAEIVPADYVINVVLTAAWNISQNSNKGTVDGYNESEPIIYNVVSSSENAINWSTYCRFYQSEGKHLSSVSAIWHPFLSFNRYLWKFRLEAIFFHWLPAYIVDFILICLFKKPMLVDGYRKISKFLDALTYFCITKWHFSNNNTQTLWKNLKKQDREMFEFSMKEFSWKKYFPGYVQGFRIYILKDPLETVAAGLRKAFVLKIVHYITVGLVLVGLYFLLFMLITKVGGLYNYICL